ncbi:unnamed protein product [Euphydryas editha]|uniref:Uncharacterized protein n=1 Tax=Euphydryas editha TaxID=104508 RepID=A0AAU9U6P2_EUPED|nr:unnamed protein product [Euphydryas editha]
MKSKEIFENHPELKEVDGAKEYIKTPVKYDIMSPEKLFSRNKFARVTCAAGRGRGDRHRWRREPASGRRVVMATTPRHPPAPRRPARRSTRNHPYKQRHTAHGCSLIYHPTHKGTLHKTVRSGDVNNAR